MRVLLAAALCLATLTACKKSVPKDWPERYSLVTVQSGHTYKVLQVTPITGHGGVRQGLGLSYVGYARNFAQLSAAAQELFEFVKAEAEANGDSTVAIVAKLGFDPNAEKTQFTDWNLVFKKGASADGGWARLTAHDDAPFPDLPARQDKDERDLKSQKDAGEKVDHVLAEIDAGHADKTWDELVPAVKKNVTRDDWAKKIDDRRAALGAFEGREKFAVMQTTGVAKGPKGLFVVFRYHTKFAKKTAEEVVSESYVDGDWHLIGYALN
jgi:hypothetical protein